MMIIVIDLLIIYDYDVLCMVLLYYFLFIVGYGGFFVLFFSCCWLVVGWVNDCVDVCLFCGWVVM